MNIVPCAEAVRVTCREPAVLSMVLYHLCHAVPVACAVVWYQLEVPLGAS